MTPYVCPVNGCDLTGEEYTTLTGEKRTASLAIGRIEHDWCVEWLCPKCGARWERT